MARRSVPAALVGGDSLLGREIQEALRDLPSIQVSTFSATGEGSFGEQEGEAIYLQPLDATTIADYEFILLAGAPEGSLKTYELAKLARRRPFLVDCQGHLETQPEARIVAPLLDEAASQRSWLRIPANPAANALALVLTRLNRFAPVRQSIANVFEPASEHGLKGINELHNQTTNLLAFKPLDKRIYDAQLAFNLLSQLGEEAPAKLSAIEQRIEHHLATLLNIESAPATLMPSLRLIQAPVFHGYSISLWVEFERNVAAQEVRGTLASAQIDVRGEGEEAPDIVGAAGQSGLIAGDIRSDRNNGRAIWIWVVTDNLRFIADSAAAILKQGRPSLP